mmetsp:Transcript_86302/g.105891  ORF Transcript_86302/g.105891 Transcript_86302/m.105891 type:complete len:201 (-) Transcript_86302:152-754(-)
MARSLPVEGRHRHESFPTHATTTLCSTLAGAFKEAFATAIPPSRFLSIPIAHTRHHKDAVIRLRQLFSILMQGTLQFLPTSLVHLIILWCDVAGEVAAFPRASLFELILLKAHGQRRSQVPFIKAGVPVSGWGCLLKTGSFEGRIKYEVGPPGVLCLPLLSWIEAISAPCWISHLHVITHRNSRMADAHTICWHIRSQKA